MVERLEAEIARMEEDMQSRLSDTVSSKSNNGQEILDAAMADEEDKSANSDSEDEDEEDER